MKTPISLLVCVFFLTLVGCASATPVQPEPLPTTDQDQLECLLVGSWMHTSSGDAPLQKMAQNAYHLKTDGTGHIEPNSGGQAMFGLSDRIVEFTWEVDGRNLYMHRNDGDTDVYRVDDWGTRQMDWFFYNGSTDYGVTRHDDTNIPSC